MVFYDIKNKYELTGDSKHTQVKSDAFTVFKDVQDFECKRDLEDLSLIQNAVDKPAWDSLANMFSNK